MTERAAALTRTLDLFSELLGTQYRRATDLALAEARVRIVALDADLGLPAAQVFVAILALLLARTGIGLEWTPTTVQRRVAFPRMGASTFDLSLGRAVEASFPGATISPPVGPSDLVVALGRCQTGSNMSSVLRVGARGCRASVDWAASAEHWTPANGLVAAAAAGLAATEVVKAVLRRVDTAGLPELRATNAEFVLPFPLSRPLDLGSVEAISAGAIIQNLLLVLLADPAITGSFRVFDGDDVAISNLNRCPLAFMDSIGRKKVDVIETELAGLPLQIRPVPRHLDNATVGLIDRKSVIVVGADDVLARHQAQRLDPAWLGVGATSHFLDLVTEHPMGTACAGCAHPRPGEDLEVIPTTAIVSYWAGLLLAIRLIAFRSGQPYPPSRRVTNFWPLLPSGLLEHALAFNPRCPIGHAS